MRSSSLFFSNMSPQKKIKKMAALVIMLPLISGCSIDVKHFGNLPIPTINVGDRKDLPKQKFQPTFFFTKEMIYPQHVKKNNDKIIYQHKGKKDTEFPLNNYSHPNKHLAKTSPSPSQPLLYSHPKDNKNLNFRKQKKRQASLRNNISSYPSKDKASLYTPQNTEKKNDLNTSQIHQNRRKIKNNPKIEPIAKEKGGISHENNKTIQNRTEQSSSNKINSGKEKPDKYLWPAIGKVVDSFQKNNGIDIFVPSNTPIKAATDGTVIYSGNVLVELGNIVLIRHDNSMVTVYAHASVLHVSKGQQVRRGQIIALSGMSGNTQKPKVHFEVRKKSIAVHPINFLEKSINKSQ
ncbi:M23 family metallopeptidase [Candidatus Liberibacter sp.]|uniref:M23 family metallopeptidase n=1 Tax=Candidatus Liberibacter sp. TaxID=34022 RepID=UPI0015F5AF90|nr:M23 family metallopeptidase [Candidatus Liberibacter sp.]MBA5723810.1 M23 family metallopeptidase [Candidatus Liberibacter sp.]